MNIKKLLDFKCSFYALYLFLIKTIYGFDKWHWRSNYWCRTYKKIVVKELNNLPINDVAVDLGGGLGEIIGRLKTKRNILIDLDEKVLKASKMIPFLKITDRIKGSWEVVSKYTPNTIDIFITIGWLHGINPENLKNDFEEILQEKYVKFLVVDELIEPWKGAHKHNFLFLEKFNYRLLKTFNDGGEGIRKFHIFQKIN